MGAGIGAAVVEAMVMITGPGAGVGVDAGKEAGADTGTGALAVCLPEWCFWLHSQHCHLEFDLVTRGV